MHLCLGLMEATGIHEHVRHMGVDTCMEVGDACKIDGRMDENLYIKILEDDLQSSLAFYDRIPQGIIFQQDNDSKHTCKKAQIDSKTMICRSYYGLDNLQT